MAAPFSALLASCASGGSDIEDGAVAAQDAVVDSSGSAVVLSMRVLTYNVAGLPAGLSASMPDRYSPLISPLLNDYDLVLLQENFAYQAQIASMVRLPYASPADTRGDSLGDGLSTFANAPLAEFERVPWTECFGMFDSGSDCLTPKGFTFTRVEFDPQTSVDVYNVHAEAGSSAADVSARASNLEQLARAVTERSSGRAVIVAGDFNARYTRAGDTLHTLLSQTMLRDAWADVVRAGFIPREGDVVSCSSEPNDPACERIDKVLYRANELVALRPLDYAVEGARFVDATGAQLSDHRPVAVRFELTVRPR